MIQKVRKTLLGFLVLTLCVPKMCIRDRVYTAYINGGKSELSNARNYTTMDAFPTTLAAIGVEIEGNRLGLGTNLFSSEQTLTERFGIEKEEKELNKQSELMTQLADIDESSEVLLVREGKIPTGCLLYTSRCV